MEILGLGCGGFLDPDCGLGSKIEAILAVQRHIRSQIPITGEVTSGHGGSKPGSKSRNGTGTGTGTGVSSKAELGTRSWLTPAANSKLSIGEFQEDSR